MDDDRRLIPAHAGKTSTPDFGSGHLGAHPRSRGENAAHDCLAPGGSGSSPLTRGKLEQLHPGLVTARLIPAHAGKTTYRAGVQLTARAHPRSRGENHIVQQVRLIDVGSSPLTRGKRAHFSAGRRGSGLIPAHAGKTAASGGPTNPGGAHPRSRGENHEIQAVRAVDPGSSPLTRGKRVAPPAPTVGPGLIPAHAGKTSS